MCMYVCMHVCMYVRMYVCVCIHVYTVCICEDVAFYDYVLYVVV